uniref:Uncharacterized protein n=2 Tax=Aegilops tauschii subsp. strangulata TaxID=200361 RepID=A0A453D213_AEGTS
NSHLLPIPTAETLDLAAALLGSRCSAAAPWLALGEDEVEKREPSMNPDPMEVQEPPPHRNEKTIFERCREARNFRTNARRCGTLIQPYEFSCPQTAELGFKDGYIYYSSKAIKFAADIEQGFD